MGQLRVWIDQDLCTGDGLCTDHCPDTFRLLEDGLSYVIGPTGAVHHNPGGPSQPAAVPDRHVDAVIAAAADCPGECIFLESYEQSRHEAPPPPEPPADESCGAEDPADGPCRSVPADSAGWPRRVVVQWRRGDGATTVLSADRR